MEYKTGQQCIADLKKGKVMPVYILHGTEAFYIDEVTKYMEDELLSDGEKAFNQSVLYGRDVDSKSVLDHARQFPMMAERRVVIVKEAQGMRDLKSLDSYISNPSPQTVFVLAHKKKLDGRIKWVKEAKTSDQVGLLASEPVPEYKIQRWLQDYIKGLGMTISPDAAEMMTQHLGTDLKKITNEISKIRVNLQTRNDITAEEVEKYVGISRDYDIYGLLKALAQGDISRAHTISLQLEANSRDQPLQRVIPGMASYFEKVMIVSQHRQKDDNSLGRMIGAYSSHVKEYKMMASRYTYEGLQKVYHMLVKADAAAKGVDRRRPSGILTELIGKLILLQRST